MAGHVEGEPRGRTRERNSPKNIQRRPPIGSSDGHDPFSFSFPLLVKNNDTYFYFLTKQRGSPFAREPEAGKIIVMICNVGSSTGRASNNAKRLS